MKPIELNKYQGVLHLLNQKPEKSMIVGYWLAIKLTADDIAETLGCSKRSVGVYIRRLRKDGYDVRINRDGEYWIEPEKSFCPDFQISIGFDKYHDHMIKTTHNGSQWSSIQLGNVRELRQLQAALGEYIDTIAKDYTVPTPAAALKERLNEAK